MIEIARATLKDVGELFSLENSVFVSADGLLSKRAFSYHIKKENLLLLYKIEGKIAGYILVFCPKHKSYARVYSLGVLPIFRGQGIADALLKEALGSLDTRYKRIFLEVRKSNIVAICLYERFNFAVLREVLDYYSDGQSALKMCRAMV